MCTSKLVVLKKDWSLYDCDFALMILFWKDIKTKNYSRKIKTLRINDKFQNNEGKMPPQELERKFTWSIVTRVKTNYMLKEYSTTT